MAGQAPTGAAESGTATPGISVVLPAFNVADLIDNTTAALRRELLPLAQHLEMIVVDDGSNDTTAEVTRKIRRQHGDVRLLRNRTNLGKGLSVYVGILASQHTHVCFTDADLAFSTGDYARELHTGIEEVPVRIIYNDFQSSVRLAGDSARFLVGLASICRRARAGEYAAANPEMAPERIWSWTEEADAA